MVSFLLLVAFYAVIFALTDWFLTLWLAAAGLVVYIAFVFIQAGSRKNEKKVTRSRNRLASIKNFTPTQILNPSFSNTGILLDEKNQKICFFEDGVSFRYKICNYADVLAVEIFEDGHTTTKTARSSQLGGAVVGELLLGETGLLLGGLTGKKTSTKIINRIDLRITINDTKEPFKDVVLYIHNGASTHLLNQAQNSARHWNSLLSVLIKRSEQKAITEKPTENIKPPVTSIADEVKKLAELRSSGILNEAEYEKQKDRLLNS